MPSSVPILRLNGDTQSVPITRKMEPNRCPLCHVTIVPKVYGGVELPKQLMEIMYLCVHRPCMRCFIVRYKPYKDQGYLPIQVLPSTPPKVNVSSQIAEISPKFVEIYEQALASESFNLSQLTGIGLRKALEFLIKDFLIWHSTDELRVQTIETTPLGRCIKEHIDDTQVKEVALRANWLGNDETHYRRYWKDKDIEDLKRLIVILLNWMENALLADEYVKSMPEQ